METTRPVTRTHHFVVRASGDSMTGGPIPIHDGDLVLCRWTTVSDPKEVEGKPVLLTGGAAGETIAFLKVPVRIDGRWVLRSTNPSYDDLPLEPGVTLRAVGQPIEVVRERVDPVQWGLYDRAAIAGLFGQKNGPAWKTGHRDVEIDGEQHTILMVNLRKPRGTKVEHRYNDIFVSPDTFQWESQASTSPQGAKGQRILQQARDGRKIHLFVRYNTKNVRGKAEPYVYCGPVHTLRYEGSKPMRVTYQLEAPLPDRLWRAWSTG